MAKKSVSSEIETKIADCSCVVEKPTYDWQITAWKVARTLLMYGIPIGVTWLLDWKPEVLGPIIGVVAQTYFDWSKHKTPSEK